MKILQKIIIPILFLVAGFLIYSIYFAPKAELGAFDSFDTNNNANKDIIVSWIKQKGISTDEANGTVMFYAVDNKGVEYPVQAPLPVPSGFENSERVKLKGHLHKDHFHAVELSLE